MKSAENISVKIDADSSDQELMSAFQGGDTKAFEILVKRYQDAIVNYAFRFLGNYEDATDIAQETFMRLYKNRMMYEPIAKFSTWLYTIAGNVAKSELRRRKTSRVVPLSQTDEDGEEQTWDVPDTEYTPDKTVDVTLIEQYLQEALMKIPASYRDVIIMRDIQDMEYEDIAKITGLPLGTVKSRINRGRLQLQKLLKDIYEQT
ncbi:MAG TPA: sigma-70 family RNA polymerase sigma factor [Candidatus Kapabacteria bacterium]|nr:sigma-70 family RNA polymerase sigma factor [Candidatus Kapabacteria bacterium]